MNSGVTVSNPSIVSRGHALEALRARFAERLSTAEAVRRNHASVEGYHPDLLADAVLTVHGTGEVADAVRICAEHRLPIIPYGAGSSLEGHVLAPTGGLCIDLSEMNAVLEVNADDLDARVQAGVTRKQLNLLLRDQGLFYPVDPGADASFGGMVSTRATGTTTVRYGGTRANLLGLTVVLASGEIIRTGGRARKSSAGYDLTGLFCGAEGTLGVITEAQVRLYGLQDSAAAVCSFESLVGAVSAVTQAIQIGSQVARIELLDPLSVRAVNAYAHTDYPERPTLFLEWHGLDAGLAEQIALFEGIALANGSGTFHWARAAEDRSRLWDARHKAYFAALALAPGKKAIITDVCVPVSALAGCLTETRADIDDAGLIGPILGHVGDGNFHAVILVDPNDSDEAKRADTVAARMVDRALAVGGTCTGEHGIGLGKKAHLIAEQGPSVDTMRTIKRALDPLNIMKPGKVFDL